MANPDAVPSEYLRKHTWFTFHQDRPAVKNRHRLGGAHLMWASHFPYEDSNFPDSRQQAMRVTDEMPADERHACWPATSPGSTGCLASRRASPGTRSWPSTSSSTSSLKVAMGVDVDPKTLEVAVSSVCPYLRPGRNPQRPRRSRRATPRTSRRTTSLPARSVCRPHRSRHGSNLTMTDPSRFPSGDVAIVGIGCTEFSRATQA